MNKNKKKRYYFSLFLLSICQCTSNLKPANTTFQSYDLISFFDEDAENKIDESFNAYLTSRSCTVDPLDLVQILTGSSPEIPIHLETLTQKNLYARTNPTITRPISDLPYFQTTPDYHSTQKQNLQCSFFYNQTTSKYFYNEDSSIREYLGLFNDDFTEFFEDLSKALKNIDPDSKEISVDSILGLFSNIKLEERRAGTVFAWNWETRNFKLQTQLPLYYIEHNFMLTEDEQAAIANNEFVKEFTRDQPANDPNALNKAIREHVAEDLLGLGDIKISFLAKGCVGNLSGSLGPELILPSACIFTDKLIGGRFENCPKQPSINFLMFACALEEGLAQKELDVVKQFGIGIIERLTRITGNTSLGQGYLSMYGRGEIEYFMTPSFSQKHMIRIGGGTSYYTTRFFNENKQAAAFDRDYDSQALATDNLRFLQDQFVSSTYPFPRSVLITPGPRLEYRGALKKEHWAGKLECGYDFWFQGAEQISLQHNYTRYFSLNMETARPSNAFENKLFASLTWIGSRNTRDWNIALFGDYTFYSQGTGNDWSLGFSGNIYW